MLAPPLTLLTAGNSSTPLGRSVKAAPRKCPSTTKPRVPASASKTNRTRSGTGRGTSVSGRTGGEESPDLPVCPGYSPKLRPPCHRWLLWSSQPQDWGSPPTSTLYPDACRGQLCLEIPMTAWLPLWLGFHTTSHTCSPTHTPFSALTPSLLRSTGERMTSSLQAEGRKWGERWTKLQCERLSPGATGMEFKTTWRREAVGTASELKGDEEKGGGRSANLRHSQTESESPIGPKAGDLLRVTRDELWSRQTDNMAIINDTECFSAVRISLIMVAVSWHWKSIHDQSNFKNNVSLFSYMYMMTQIIDLESQVVKINKVRLWSIELVEVDQNSSVLLFFFRCNNCKHKWRSDNMILSNKSTTTSKL